MPNMWNGPLAPRLRTPRLVLRSFEPGDGRVLRALHERTRSERPSLTAMENRACELYARFEHRLELTWGVFGEAQAPWASLTLTPRPDGALAVSWLDTELSAHGCAAEALAGLVRVAFELGLATRIEVADGGPDDRLAAAARSLGFFERGATLALDRAVFPCSAAAAAQVMAYDKLGRPLLAAAA